MRRAGNPLWLLVAPTAGALVLALLAADAPLQARWAVGRADFEQAAARALQGEDRTAAPGGRIGMFDISFVQREGDAVVLYEKTGALGNDAGFVYFPNGPRADVASFESPEYVHLGGPWYSFTASW